MIPSLNQISNQNQQSKNDDSNIDSSVHSSYSSTNIKNNPNASSRQSDNINAHSYNSSNFSTNLLFSPRLNLFQTQSNRNLKQTPQPKTPTFSDTNQFISPFNNDDNNQKFQHETRFLNRSNINNQQENQLNSNINDRSQISDDNSMAPIKNARFVSDEKGNSMELNQRGRTKSVRRNFHSKSESLNKSALKSFEDEQNQTFTNKPKRLQSQVSHQNLDKTNDSILNEIERPQRSNFHTKSGELNEPSSSNFDEKQNSVFHNKRRQLQTPIPHHNTDQNNDSILDEIERPQRSNLQTKSEKLNESSSSNFEEEQNHAFYKKQTPIHTPISHQNFDQTNYSILDDIERSLQVEIRINSEEFNDTSSKYEKKHNRSFNKKRKRIQTPIPHHSSNQTNDSILDEIEKSMQNEMEQNDEELN